MGFRGRRPAVIWLPLMILIMVRCFAGFIRAEDGRKAFFYILLMFLGPSLIKELSLRLIHWPGYE